MEMQFQVKTAGGYDFYEVASAMQKEIRRGLEEEALYWALELAGKYDEFLWKRLAIVASEDIGPADNSMALLIDSLAVHYFELAKQKGRPQERIVLAHAIIALCRAPKSRIADNLACVVSHQRESEGLKRQIPDYALDQHTQRGKRLGRGIEHWSTEGCQLAAEAEGLDIYRERALQMRLTYGRLKPRQQSERRRSQQPPLFNTPEE